jgi:SAM-dependent methyltransferase
MNLPKSDHWVHHARQWALVREPLRPGLEDISFVKGGIERWLANTLRTDPSILVLGVTPELCSLTLNGASQFIAVDSSYAMIRTWWTGRTKSHDAVICADWQKVPLQSSSIDIVLADGSLCLIPFPTGQMGLFKEVRRLLRPGGQCFFRCFVQPEEKESCDQIMRDLHSGRIGNFHVLKWRLAMALQANSRAGVEICRIWETVHEEFRTLDTLADQQNWPRAEVGTLDAYRGVSTRYFFPTLEEHLKLFTSCGFTVSQISTPGYELGQRCPSVTLALGASDSTCS